MPPHEKESSIANETTATQPASSLHTDQLIQLAAAEGESCVRGPDKIFTEWYTWASQHAQRAAVVQVFHGRQAWKQDIVANNNEDCGLAIVSWNVLSQTWYLKSRAKGEYTHTPENTGVWENCFAQLIAWIQELNAHLYLLQEVDFEHFDTQWLPAMQALGYDGRMQRRRNNKKKDEKQPCGLAIFYKAIRLQPTLDPHTQQEQVESTLRCMAIRFERKSTTGKQTSKQHFVAINVHLESTQRTEGFQRRARQLNSPLEWARNISRNAAACPIVLAGDYNTGAVN